MRDIKEYNPGIKKDDIKIYIWEKSDIIYYMDLHNIKSRAYEMIITNLP